LVSLLTLQRTLVLYNNISEWREIHPNSLDNKLTTTYFIDLACWPLFWKMPHSVKCFIEYLGAPISDFAIRIRGNLAQLAFAKVPISFSFSHLLCWMLMQAKALSSGMSLDDS